MELHEIHSHWTNWSSQFGKSLRATTKSSTAKSLEVSAFRRAMQLESGFSDVLEVGCGNGINCIELAEQFPDTTFHGVDYVAEMVDAAIENAKDADLSSKTDFFVGNVLELQDVKTLKSQYDIVFTNRCLINLNQMELQIKAIGKLCEKIRPGGVLLMIENSFATYDRQNNLRECMGLEKRSPAEFNLFFDEAHILPALEEAGMELERKEDFSSLHDIMLYVLVPSMNGGTVDYDHPLVKAATILSETASTKGIGNFGDFGQNRLFVARKNM